jgi:hypothetical protein
LTQNLERVTEGVADPALRNHIERLFQQLSEIKTEVLPVGHARDILKNVRGRIHKGGAALIADRGIIRNANETTLMISLGTFQRLVVKILSESAQFQAHRRWPGEVLTGLAPTSGVDLKIDFEGIAGGEPDRAGTGIEL